VAAVLLTNTETAVVCAAALALGLVLGKILFAGRAASPDPSAATPLHSPPTTELQRRIIQLLGGSTVAVDPSEVPELLDSILEKALKSPARKFILRFEIWPAATAHWHVSALGSDTTSANRNPLRRDS